MFISPLTKIMLRFSLFFSLLGLLSLHACRREIGIPNADAELLVPIAKMNLNIENILSDSLTRSNPDGSITLVYRSTLFAAQLGAFEKLETREFNETAKLQSLSLGTQSAQRFISLGQVAENLGPPIGPILSSQHGTNGILPLLPGLNFGPIDVDGSAFFETVTLDSGFMDISITNGFPTGLSNIEFEIRNQSDNSLVGQSSFSQISPGASATETIDLAGKTVEGNLLGTITNFDVDGTNGASVPIDTTDVIEINISVRDMKISSATAIFPAQDIISLNDTAQLGGSGIRDLKIVEAKAASGTVNLRVVSTVEDTLYFNYLIPNGTKNGIPFSISEAINPAPAGGSIERILQYDVSGYTFDLTGSPLINHYNAFYSELTGRIDSTGRIVNLSLEDSLLIYVQLSDFIPEFANGYLGNSDTTIGQAAAPLDLFKNVKSGSIDFEEIKLGIGIKNGNGVPFELNLSQLNAQNIGSGNQVSLDLSELPSPLTVEAASDENTPWENEWRIDNATQNLNEALNILPNRFSAQVQFESNPAKDSANLSQFAIDSNALEAYADLEIPLHFIADELTLQDTAAFNAGRFERPEYIKGGTLYLIANNAYPISATIRIDLLDENDIPLDFISFSESIAPSANGQNTQTALEWNFDEDNIDVLQQTTNAVFTLQFSSDGSAPVQILSTESINLQLTSRVNYQSAE